jgi:hypothetical protein
MMNERIQELATEAEFSEKDLHIQGDNFQRFAELIALECAELMEKQHSWITNIAASKLIRQHFGVEE